MQKIKKGTVLEVTKSLPLTLPSGKNLTIPFGTRAVVFKGGKLLSVSCVTYTNKGSLVNISIEKNQLENHFKVIEPVKDQHFGDFSYKTVKSPADGVGFIKTTHLMHQGLSIGKILCERGFTPVSLPVPLNHPNLDAPLRGVLAELRSKGYQEEAVYNNIESHLVTYFKNDLNKAISFSDFYSLNPQNTPRQSA